jgi:hypothetical protein
MHESDSHGSYESHSKECISRRCLPFERLSIPAIASTKFQYSKDVEFQAQTANINCASPNHKTNIGIHKSSINPYTLGIYSTSEKIQKSSGLPLTNFIGGFLALLLHVRLQSPSTVRQIEKDKAPPFLLASTKLGTEKIKQGHEMEERSNFVPRRGDLMRRRARLRRKRRRPGAHGRGGSRRAYEAAAPPWRRMSLD